MRVTTGVLQRKVSYLNRISGRNFYVQGQGMGRGTGYRLWEINTDSSETPLNGLLLEAREMYQYLDGMIACLEYNYTRVEV